MTRTRILVADSRLIFRAGVRRLLSAHSDFEVVEAADLFDVLDVVGEGSPDIALVELELPPNGGLEAVARLSEDSACRTIVWSCYPSSESILDAIRAGASGYLDKSISPWGLLRALRGVAHEEAPISRDLAMLLVEAMHGRERRRDAFERFAVLSARERQVLDLVARGARNRQIAQALFISEFTVKRHMQNILKKLDLPSRKAAAALYNQTFGSGPQRVLRPINGAA